jgi:hypothetical protein
VVGYRTDTLPKEEPNKQQQATSFGTTPVDRVRLLDSVNDDMDDRVAIHVESIIVITAPTTI